MVRAMLTTPQAAAVLGVSPATLRTWRARGQGPRYKQPAGPGSSAAYAPEVVDLFKMERDRKARQRALRNMTAMDDALEMKRPVAERYEP